MTLLYICFMSIQWETIKCDYKSYFSWLQVHYFFLSRRIYVCDYECRWNSL